MNDADFNNRQITNRLDGVTEYLRLIYIELQKMNLNKNKEDGVVNA